MKEEIIIRREQEKDYGKVEEMIRKAFWNLYVPGCTEHFLAHVIREHGDFVKELDLVLELNGQLIGSIMYTKAKLVAEQGEEKEILTFGPLSILPEFQRQGYGRRLMEASFQQALRLGYDTIVIFGSPANYVSSGFKSCKKYNVSLEDGTYPAAMLVKELRPEVLEGSRWVYYQSQAFEIREEDAQSFDQRLEKMEKAYQVSQEEFYILSHAIIK